MVACRNFGALLWVLAKESRFFFLVISLLDSDVGIAVAGFLDIQLLSNNRSDALLSMNSSVPIDSVLSNRFFRTLAVLVSNILLVLVVTYDPIGDSCGTFSWFSLLLSTHGLREKVERLTFTRNGDGDFEN